MYIESHVPLEERPQSELNRCFEDYTYYITLDPKVSPVVHDARCVIKTKECDFLWYVCFTHQMVLGLAQTKLTKTKKNQNHPNAGHNAPET